ncbi:uncharacterized protein [Magallana gigas]|uniref:uncharacterized protein n=1 Tax=Magallana gigas TaxID=29159 RepID=UPI003342C124
MMKTLIHLFPLLVVCNCVMFEHLKGGATCPELFLSEYQEKNMECFDENKTAHCLIDDQNNHGLVCENILKIPKGKCPFFDNKKERMAIRQCQGKNCPSEEIYSPAAVKFDGCYKEYRKKHEHTEF